MGASKKEEKAKLGDFVEMQKGFAFKSDWYCDHGQPIVKVSNFTSDSIDNSNIVKIPFDIAKKYKKYELKEGDVVIQTVGSWPSNPASVVGKCIRVPRELNNTLLNQNAVRLKPEVGLDNDFLYYTLRTSEYSSYIVGTAQGAASQAAITLDAIRSYKLYYPPLPTQHKIAAVLSAYDDLIENNLRRIKILEEMAQNLYREWFVNFRFPGHEKARFVDSPLGRIPEGWEIKRIGDVVNIYRGKSYRSSDLAEDGGAAFINLKCIHRDGGFKREGIKRYIGSYNEKHIVKEQDIVIAVTDMTQERRIIAHAARIPSLNESISVISMDLVKVVPISQQNESFFYSLFRFSSFSDEVKQFANGANVLHLNPKYIEDYSIVMPDKRLRDVYDVICSYKYKLMDVINNKNSILRKSRDHLLPKLISGEVDVSDLDITLPEAVEV